MPNHRRGKHRGVVLQRFYTRGGRASGRGGAEGNRGQSLPWAADERRTRDQSASRYNARMPERASFLMPMGSSRRTKALILSWLPVTSTM